MHTTRSELICDAALNCERARQRQEFELNRFNLALDFEVGRARLEDVTDATASGSLEPGLTELVAAIQCTAGGA